MWVVLLILVTLYFGTGVIANIIDIYNFFKEKDED